MGGNKGRSTGGVKQGINILNEYNLSCVVNILPLQIKILSFYADFLSGTCNKQPLKHCSFIFSEGSGKLWLAFQVNTDMNFGYCFIVIITHFSNSCWNILL